MEGDPQQIESQEREVDLHRTESWERERGLATCNGLNRGRERETWDLKCTELQKREGDLQRTKSCKGRERERR